MLKQAFTILELLIVVIIIGVLATLGFVNYGGVRETSITKEARANLKLIAAAERIYRMEVGYFYPSTGTVTGVGAENTINNNLRLSLPEVAARRWNYQIDSESDDDLFTATATRNNAAACAWTMDQGDTEAGLTAASATANCPQ